MNGWYKATSRPLEGLDALLRDRRRVPGRQRDHERGRQPLGIRVLPTWPAIRSAHGVGIKIDRTAPGDAVEVADPLEERLVRERPLKSPC